MCKQSKASIDIKVPHNIRLPDNMRLPHMIDFNQMIILFHIMELPCTKRLPHKTSLYHQKIFAASFDGTAQNNKAASQDKADKDEVTG